ncbi:hypothetical protein V5T82_01960 [Magnetovibrio sp. PR-2]|uniref:hypothetical protein n=1 Tax=Magnetovibrio sp. PR-2 TaxID=3120356 RepID=UPI002FCE24FC
MITRRHFLMLGTAALVGGCATDTPIAGPIPELGFQHLPPMFLNVGSIQVKNEYLAPMKAPNAEHRFPTPPAQAMAGWARSRIQAVGGKNNGAVATFVIEEASVKEVVLKKTEGFKGLFTYEPTERYDAHCIGRLEIVDANGAKGNVRVEAMRSAEVSENATLAEREKAWFEMIEKLMGDFNTQMDEQIVQHLSAWAPLR